ncbi:MAG TPA: DUF1232 domain-containing protein [Firmicutes bacterium]|nr:DUF1232 domain-containing protein [Candidatus Fermentithermobacillaceae bacterium]
MSCTQDQNMGKTDSPVSDNPDGGPHRTEGLTDRERRTYDRIRKKVSRALQSTVPPKYERVPEILLLLPDFVVLIFRLLKDPRVPKGSKIKLALYAFYLAMPVELVPDFLPVLGQLDDLVGAVLVVRQILRTTPEGVVREHWSGQGDILENIQKVLDISSEVMGSGILRKILSRLRR